jgi:hypothetical protein
MSIGRFLILAAVVWLAITLYRRARRAAHCPPTDAQARLVRCDRCGVFLPAHEARATASGGRACAHHRDA